MDQYVKLAKDTVETYVKTGKTISPPDNLPKKMLTKKAGAFVSIHKKSSRGRSASGRDGSLRGCIGTFLPTKENIAQEVIANAISATHDPRLLPVSEEELPGLVYSVDILSIPRPASRKEINPKKYGLLVMAPDGRKGLLLPDIPGVKTAEEQIAICKRKAGIAPPEKVRYETFTVERHH